MKYFSQLAVILMISFVGEWLHAVLPLPIPASIYGLVLLFVLLCGKVIRLEQVRETGHFLVNIMAVMFVSPAVGLLMCWDIVRDNLGKICLILVVTLVLTFFVSGRVTQMLLKREGKTDD